MKACSPWLTGLVLLVVSGCSLLVPQPDDYTYGGADGAVPDADGLPDGCVLTTYFRDSDGDGRGTDDDTRAACEVAPNGYVATGGDCDDTDETIVPGADETCDGVDEDCDGTFDEGLTPQATYYRDADGDGAGDDADNVSACMAPAGFVDEGGDCAPADELIFPGAGETCDGADNDCDSGIDEGVIEPLGAELALGSSNLSLSITSTDSAHWVAWPTGSEVVLQELTAGNTLGRTVTWDRGPSTVDWPVVSAVDTAAGPRLVVAWREDSEAVAAVVDASDPMAGAPFTLGAHDGDQRALSLHTYGNLVLAAWLTSTDLRARVIEPVGSSTQGTLLSEPVSTAPAADFFARPSIQQSSQADELLVAYPAQVSGDSSRSANLGRVRVGASPTWLGRFSGTAPFSDIRHVITAPLRDGVLRTLIADATGRCWNVADEATGFSVTCEPAVGRLVVLSSLKRRGGVVSTIVSQPTGSLDLLDVADAPGTEGGSLQQLSTDATEGDISFLSGDQTQGVAVFTDATGTPPFALRSRRLGCR